MNRLEWLTSNNPVAMLEWMMTKEPYSFVGNPSCSRKLRLFACACVRRVWDLLKDDVNCDRCTAKISKSPLFYTGKAQGLPCPDCHGAGRISRSRCAVEVAERFADGEATADELSKARSGAADARNWGNESPEFYPQWMAHVATCIGPESIISVINRQEELPQLIPPAIQAAILRDIVGNPFKPVTLPKTKICKKCKWDGEGPNRKYCDFPQTFDGKVSHLWADAYSWFTSTVTAIAGRIYDEGRFDLMPQLADALEVAGCDNVDVLRHCRDEVRIPCWSCEGRGTHLGSGPDRGNPTCDECQGDGTLWRTRPYGVPHVRGCWLIDTILDKE